MQHYSEMLANPITLISDEAKFWQIKTQQSFFYWTE